MWSAVFELVQCTQYRIVQGDIKTATGTVGLLLPATLPNADRFPKIISPPVAALALMTGGGSGVASKVCGGLQVWAVAMHILWHLNGGSGGRVSSPPCRPPLFTTIFNGKSVTEWSLQIPPHLKSVAILPCELSGAFSTIRAKQTVCFGATSSPIGCLNTRQRATV